MKQTRREDSVNANKETRWDRIRKKCTAGNGGPLSLKSETVRRFIETDYIGKHNTSLLHGEQDMRTMLDPALVMDLRHEMFQKIPRKLPLATVENQKNLQSCRAHNIAVDERYIDNELNKLRQQLERNRKRNEIKFVQTKTIKKKDMLLVVNEILMKSLGATSKHIKDFYTAPLEAYEEFDEIFKFKEDLDDDEIEKEDNKFFRQTDELTNQIECKLLEDNMEEKIEFKNGSEGTTEQFSLEETIKLELELRQRNYLKITKDSSDFKRHTPSPLTPTDEFLKSIRDVAAKHQAEIRRVRFEDEVDAQNYYRDDSTCSNTSDGLDSLISDLADEALKELQAEEDCEMEEREKEDEIKKENWENEKEGKELEEYKEDNKAEKGEEDGKEAAELLEKEEVPRFLEILEVEEVETMPDPVQKISLEIKGDAAVYKESEEALLTVKKLQLPPVKGSQKNDHQIETKLSSEDEDESFSVHEQNLIIEQLFQSRAQTNIVTMRKYFLKWIHYTTITKIERENISTKNDRIHQINLFLDKIRKEKKRISSKPQTKESTKSEKTSEGIDNKMHPNENLQLTKKYQSKIKIQQDIIDLQRLKLERQERLIMELKLKKLSDEAKEARQEIKNELKAVIRSGDPKVKAKAKCLQLIGNLRDVEDEDEFKRLQGKALLMPKFLQKMQERALERSIRHEQARQRRLQQEAEREAQKTAVEEAKRLEDEEAKRMRIEALKEKRRQEKMAKVLKERERQRAIENNKKAHEFCRLRLLRRIGMEGFKRLLQRKRDYNRKSETLRRRVIRRTYFVAWRDFYYFELSRRIQKADKLYCVLLKRQVLKLWINYVTEEHGKYYVAIDWYDLKLSTFMFKEWADHTRRMKAIEETKTRKAISHYEWNLKFKVLDCWQRLQQILQLEKETEERRQRWRMKIWELLPDYTPRLDTFV